MVTPLAHKYTQNTQNKDKRKPSVIDSPLAILGDPIYTVPCLLVERKPTPTTGCRMKRCGWRRAAHESQWWTGAVPNSQVASVVSMIEADECLSRSEDDLLVEKALERARIEHEQVLEWGGCAIYK